MSCLLWTLDYIRDHENASNEEAIEATMQKLTSINSHAPTTATASTTGCSCFILRHNIYKHPGEAHETLSLLPRLLLDVEKTRRKIAQDCLVRIFQKDVVNNTVVYAQEENGQMIELFECTCNRVLNERLLEFSHKYNNDVDNSNHNDRKMYTNMIREKQNLILIQTMKADLSPIDWLGTLNDLFPIIPNANTRLLEQENLQYPLHRFHLLRPHFIQLFSTVEDFVASQLGRRANRSKSKARSLTDSLINDVVIIVKEYLDRYHDHIKEMSEYVNPLFEELNKQKVSEIMSLLDQVSNFCTNRDQEEDNE
ncbi:12301_t:CDS:2 [Ambispora leptoticha]|uniref:12301_t:CDS:1 n=1 Tax=Ambispora leptoticha TaxID=144679 RepID=A0A9N9BZQ2_9GLOM|nr:12301_t:CDS:2 [Ambispora leptoticha]